MVTLPLCFDISRTLHEGSFIFTEPLDRDHRNRWGVEKVVTSHCSTKKDGIRRNVRREDRVKTRLSAVRHYVIW